MLQDLDALSEMRDGGPPFGQLTGPAAGALAGRPGSGPAPGPGSRSRIPVTDPGPPTARSARTAGPVPAHASVRYLCSVGATIATISSGSTVASGSTWIT